MTDNTELLPCPFCGGSDLTFKDDLPQFYIDCACGFDFNRCDKDDESNGIIKAWNTRTGDTNLALENQQLGEALRTQNKRIGELEEALKLSINFFEWYTKNTSKIIIGEETYEAIFSIYFLQRQALNEHKGEEG